MENHTFLPSLWKPLTELAIISRHGRVIASKTSGELVCSEFKNNLNTKRIQIEKSY